MQSQDLDKLIRERPYSFDFFQAVRLLEKMHPDRKPVGHDAMPLEEAVRFRSRIALGFASSQIQELNEVETDSDSRLEMMQNFMGIIGVSGIMPVPYTELILERIRRRDTALWEFLDIFTHRCVSLFYRAWEKYRFPIAYERGGSESGLTAYLFDFAGLGTVGMRGRMDLEDESLLPYAGLISQRPHSVNAIENVIEGHFGIKTRIIQFFPQWIEIDESDHTRIGAKNNRLGVTAIAGTRVWDQQSKFRVFLGPLKIEKFAAFLPNGTAYKSLNAIVEFLVGKEFDYDVQLCLEKAQVPATILTTRAKRKPMLGWTSFLKTKPVNEDDRQLVLQVART